MPLPPASETCATCMYRHQYTRKTVPEANLLVCRAEPPKITVGVISGTGEVVNPTYDKAFPSVDPTMWCGMWAP